MLSIVPLTSRRILRITLIIAGLSIPAIAPAATYFVGNCKSSKTYFTTIQAAVTGVPAGSIIDICPGTYPEQLTVTRPLTLHGIQSGNGALVTITVPASLNTVSTGYSSWVAQILVLNSGGPVDIKGIVVDGTGLVVSPYTAYGLASILYDSSPGTIDHVATQNLSDSDFEQATVGIMVLDDYSASPTVTATNNTVNMPVSGSAEYGIFVPGGDINLNVSNTSLLFTGTATIDAIHGIVDDSTGTATLSGNTVVMNGNATPALFFGILAGSGSNSITGNTITGAGSGIVETGTAAATIAGNSLINNVLGIDVLDPNVTIKNTQFYGVTTSTAINFECNLPAAISGNEFVGASEALSNVASGTPLASIAGSYFGVQTIETACL